MVQFPLSVGSQWGQDPAPQYRVEAVDTITSPCGDRRQTYRIHMHSNTPEDFSGSTFWIAPEIGLVRMIAVEGDLMSWRRNVTHWELLSFSSGH